MKIGREDVGQGLDGRKPNHEAESTCDRCGQKGHIQRDCIAHLARRGKDPTVTSTFPRKRGDDGAGTAVKRSSKKDKNAGNAQIPSQSKGPALANAKKAPVMAKKATSQKAKPAAPPRTPPTGSVTESQPSTKLFGIMKEFGVWK